jgi:hypothetical protein
MLEAAGITKIRMEVVLYVQDGLLGDSLSWE